MEADSERLNPEWLQGPLRGLLETLNNDGFEAFAVGGCVRDAVMGRPCNDIDVSTNATPDQVFNTLYAARWRMVPTGVEHGTWTAVKDRHTFEVTTYRRDVATDGRRATIAYADTMNQDAERRDFTMNALYMDLNGEVYDPTRTGIEDAKAGRIRFVGDAATRCREDYLRILRFYRFNATHGFDNMDKDGMIACEAYAAGLKDISRERVLMEMQKLLSAVNTRFDNPSTNNAHLWLVLTRMQSHGVLDEVFPHGHTLYNLFDLLSGESDFGGTNTDWRTRLYTVCGKNVPLPLAKKDRVFVETLATLYSNPQTLSLEALAQVHGMPLARELGYLRKDDFTGRALQVASEQKFPVKAVDFMDRGFTQGQELGKAIRQAREFWLHRNMAATRDECIAAVMGD